MAMFRFALGRLKIIQRKRKRTRKKRERE